MLRLVLTASSSSSANTASFIWSTLFCLAHWIHNSKLFMASSCLTFGSVISISSSVWSSSSSLSIKWSSLRSTHSFKSLTEKLIWKNLNKKKSRKRKYESGNHGLHLEKLCSGIEFHFSLPKHPHLAATTMTRECRPLHQTLGLWETAYSSI